MLNFYVNAQSLFNNAENVSEIKVNGRDTIKLSNVTPIVDNIVMNRRLYLADEISKSYFTLNNKPAPYDHPKIDGKAVSASDPQAIVLSHIGAHVNNARKVGNKTNVDILIDKEFASRTEQGRDVLNRIEKLKADGTPIPISTGLIANAEKRSGTCNGKKYDYVVRNIKFDHVAILPSGVAPAGTPQEGVGIFNSQDEAQTFIINGESLPIEHAEIEILDNSFEPKDSLEQKIKDGIKNFFNNKQSNSNNNEVTEMDKEQIVNALNEANKPILNALEALTKAIADNSKAQSEQLTAINSAIVESKDEKLKDMRDAVAKSFELNAEEVKGLPENTLKSMYAKTMTAKTIGNSEVKKDDDLTINTKDLYGEE